MATAPFVLGSGARIDTHDLIARFLTEIAFRDGRTYRLVPARANGQLAFGAYLHAPRPGDAQADGLLGLTLNGDRIQAMTRFTSGVFPRFGLLPTSPAGRCLSPRHRDLLDTTTREKS